MDGRVPSRVRVGEFELDLRAGELRKENSRIVLQEQPFQILLMLVERSGNLVNREEIRKRLWPNDTIVEFDHSIHTAIKKLRQALGDSADSPKYVGTVARRGYRLLVPVEQCVEPAIGLVEVSRVETAHQYEPTAAQKQMGSGAALVGKRISHYRVLGVLGGGGMGLIYWAEDIKLGRSVALKFLPEELATDPVALERFEREARAMSALDHPNICAVHEFGEHEGRHFIVMPLLEGQTLRDLISAGPHQNSPLATQRLLELAVQIAGGLAAAHRQGIIHRDIKPSNIFVTNSGVVKILDFGLAKRANTVAETAMESAGTLEAGSSPANILAHPTLTRAGVALGTAAYMSPEQVRGEPLDARSDLFSFGLVLYEMATGHQAFEGATVAIVNEAILHRSQAPVRQLNSRVSLGLEKIINKALEKNCAKRYQSAEEMRHELARRQERRSSLRWLVAGAAALLLLALAVFRPGKNPQASLPELKETQITASSSDLPVTSQAISPDGKYLAYSDAHGIHLKLLATGETQTLSQEPSEAYFAWFPDSMRFLASQDFRPGISAFSLAGGAPTDFRREGMVSMVSPDGSLVSYTTNEGQIGSRDIWIVGTDGKNPRKFLSVPEDSSIQEPIWSPDGRRVLYSFQRLAGNNLETRLESRDLHGGPPVVLYSESDPATSRPRLKDFMWLADGRVVFSLLESGPDLINSFTTRSNLWEMPVDAIGQPSGPLRRLTNWSTGGDVVELYPTADGKKLSIFRMTATVSVFLADVAADGKRISDPRRFTTTEGWNSAPVWTRDSQAIIFESNRDGRLKLFRQPVTGDTAQPILLESSEAGLPALSPDDASLLYLSAAHDPVGGPAAPINIMRAPVSGGPSQLVLSARIYDSPRCARSPATLCAIAEPSENRKEMIFTLFDPVQGRGRELTRFAVDPTADYAWDLSPNGEQIAILKRVPRSDGKIFASEGPFHILSLDGQPAREVRAKGWNRFHEYVDWAPDGKGLIVSGLPDDNATLLRVGLQGNVSVLWSEKGVYLFRAVPSPDGRHLAMLRRTANNNVWLLENF